MIFALLFVFAVAAAWWALCFQRRAADIAHRRSADGVDVHETSGAAPTGGVAARGQQGVPATVATVAQLERPVGNACTSVLGWDNFQLTSTLVFDGTVLLSCRRLPGDEPAAAPRWSRRTKSARDRSQVARPSAIQPGAIGGDFGGEELTMVLLIGEDERAERAVCLLEAWQISQATLRLRPTAVAGAIEVLDDRRRALRAPLLVA